MKINKLLISAILLSWTSIACAQSHQYKVSIIAFYNLENLYDTIDDPNKSDEEFLPGGNKHYTSEVYLDKLGKLSEVLSQVGTDKSPDGWAILGCAEIENDRVLQDLISQPKLKERNLKIVHYDSPDLRGVDVGLLYNPKYFNPEHSEPLFVELHDPDGSIRYTRDILYVKGNFNGEPLHIFVNHWPSRRGGEEASAPGRAKAAGIVRQKMDSITAIDPKAKIVGMGDLNDDPVSPSVAKVIGSKGEKSEVQPGGMFNPWVKPYKEGIGTLAYNDSWNLFDQIMISYGFLDQHQSGWFYREWHIFSKPWMMQTDGRWKGYPKRTYDFDRYAGGYSDHFPTYLVLLKQID